jgi:ribosome biogenesis protein ENP2
VVATGIYPPAVKLYETHELSEKHERRVDSEIIQMRILSDDYTKIALLEADRNIELHAQYGKHFKIRIPKFGRDMVYQPFTCDLVTVGASNEINRLNLGLGRFQTPLESNSPEINCCTFSPKLGLLSTGGTDGRVEFWDFDTKKRCIELPL